MVEVLRRAGKGDYAVFRYPDDLGEGLDSGDTWRGMFRRSERGVVNRIAGKVRECCRDLVWRREMYEVVWNLAEEEEGFRKRRDMRVELEGWRNGERERKLDKLYEVRDVFEKRVEAGREKLTKMGRERDRR